MSLDERMLASAGEGPVAEPRALADVLLLARERVRAVLPPGWTAETSVAGPDGDATLALAYDARVVSTFFVKFKRAITRAEVTTLAQAQAEKPGRSLVLSRYLPPPVQEMLREQGIAYADATGNVLLTSSDPLLVVTNRGASADPWRGRGRPTTSLKGLPAARLVRALVDYAPPYSVPELAAAARASLGATYRLVEYLENEALVVRAKRGPITDVDWPLLLRRWSEVAGYRETSTTRGYLEPRGMDGLLANLRDADFDEPYAVSGSLAAAPYAPYAEPRMALLYVNDPVTIAQALRLRPVDSGANVLLVAPRSPVVFERSSRLQGITLVAPSQASADLLSGPGRNPSEGAHLLAWMEENTDAWRRQLDR